MKILEDIIDRHFLWILFEGRQSWRIFHLGDYDSGEAMNLVRFIGIGDEEYPNSKRDIDIRTNKDLTIDDIVEATIVFLNRNEVDFDVKWTEEVAKKNGAIFRKCNITAKDFVKNVNILPWPENVNILSWPEKGRKPRVSKKKEVESMQPEKPNLKKMFESSSIVISGHEFELRPQTEPNVRFFETPFSNGSIQIILTFGNNKVSDGFKIEYHSTFHKLHTVVNKITLKTSDISHELIESQLKRLMVKLSRTVKNIQRHHCQARAVLLTKIENCDDFIQQVQEF